MPVHVLAISGPGGVGKTSAAFEASLMLRRAGVSHALIDTDELDRLYPPPDEAAAFAEGNLAALWARFAERGVSRLILVGVVLDRPDEAAGIRRVIPGAEITFVRLMASTRTLAARVGGREIGSGRDEQLERTRRRLDEMRCDTRPGVAIVETDGRGVEEIAREALDAAGWLAEG